MKMLIYMQL